MKAKIEPRKATDRGGYIMMPMKVNIDTPRDKAWRLTKCPVCGCDCWERPLPDGLTEDMFEGKMCTGCVIRRATKKS